MPKRLDSNSSWPRLYSRRACVGSLARWQPCLPPGINAGAYRAPASKAKTGRCAPPVPALVLVKKEPAGFAYGDPRL